jgi:ubiquitin-protein ligase
VNVRLSQGVYRGANFWFDLKIPPTYPFHPPSVTCLTRVWHPSIDPRNGAITLPIFGAEWRPVLSINAVVFGLQLLFVEPVTENALNTVAAETLTADPAAFESQVKMSSSSRRKLLRGAVL